MKDINEDLKDYFNQAEKLRINGNFEGAIKLLLNILEKNKKLLPVLNSVANCYFQLNKFDLAEEYYLKCLKIDSTNIILLNNLSLLYLNTKNFKKALTVLEKSLNKNFDQEHLVEKTVYCLTELKLVNEVDKFCKKFIKIYPKNKTILSYFRRNLFQIGKYADGLQVYEKENGVIEFDNDKIRII